MWESSGDSPETVGFPEHGAEVGPTVPVDLFGARTRFRFLAYSRELSVVNGMGFMALVMSWLRAWGIEGEVQWQEDWGVEFGGDNPIRLARLEERVYRPYGARLCWVPKGRKGYQGRVERSHRTDDEEFYLLCLGSEGHGEVSSPGPEVAVVLQCGAAALWGGDGGKATDREIAGVGFGFTG